MVVRFMPAVRAAERTRGLGEVRTKSVRNHQALTAAIIGRGLLREYTVDQNSFQELPWVQEIQHRRVFTILAL